MPISATFAGLDSAGPFAEQLAFFLGKLKLPSERWDDILGAAHDRAFIVAGAAQADLVNDLYGAIADSIKNGTGLDAFRKNFNAIVLKNGWTGWTGEGSKAGQAWRTRIIYQTNMSTSYAAGRYQQLKDPGLLAIRPYWRYVHADGVAHPRPMHLAWNGLVLPHDSPFWDTHFAPNGWLCHCRVTSADAGDYAAAADAGLDAPPAGWDDIDPKTGAPIGIDKGFDYAPGANANTGGPLAQFVGDKLTDLAAPVGAEMFSAMQPVIESELQATWNSFLHATEDSAKQGDSTLLGALDSAVVDWLSSGQAVQPASAAIAIGADVAEAGKSAADLANLPALMRAPHQVLYDRENGSLLYVLPTQDGGTEQLVVEVDLATSDSGASQVVSIQKTRRSAITAGIAYGSYEVIK
jgi:hypothetical protein